MINISFCFCILANMQHQLVVDIIEALHTIELYEDLVGCNLDSDWNDDDYDPNKQMVTYWDTLSAPMSPQEINLPPNLQRNSSVPTSPIVMDEQEYEYLPVTNEDMENQTITLPNDGPSTAPLGKCFSRQPNDAFHNNDPYMYYESIDSPTDEEYFAALFTLANADETIQTNEDYERLYCAPLHYYINEKKFDIETRLTRKQYKEIRNFYNYLERVYSNLIPEQDRISDIQWNLTDF